MRIKLYILCILYISYLLYIFPLVLAGDDELSIEYDGDDQTFLSNFGDDELFFTNFFEVGKLPTPLISPEEEEEKPFIEIIFLRGITPVFAILLLLAIYFYAKRKKVRGLEEVGS